MVISESDKIITDDGHERKDQKMKHFFLLTVMCILVLSGMAYAAETETRTWTDADGVKHIVTITRETKVVESGDTSQGTEQKTQEQTSKESEKPKQQYQKTETDMPQGVNPNGSFQFDINSHKPKQ